MPSWRSPQPSGERIQQRLRDPVFWTEVIQIVKTVVAGVVAWWLATAVLGLPQPFLAPWAALLVVHATVYRSFSKGAQQVSATVIGVVLAFLAGNFLGLDLVSLGLMLLVAYVVTQMKWLRDEATTAAATALIVLTTGFDSDRLLIARLLDTGIGVAVGVVVNAVVWPPLRDHTAAQAVEAVSRKVGDLLAHIAREVDDDCRQEHVDGWVRRTQQLDTEVDRAWALVRQARESGRLNPRRDSARVRRPGTYGELLDRVEQSLADIRSMARTIGHSVSDSNTWDHRFRDRWVAVLEDVADAIRDPEPESLGHAHAELRRLVTDFSDDGLSQRHWPEYGGLVLNLRNIVTAMSRVTEIDPLEKASKGPLGTAAL
jgi:uncharacterized membrane protein YgaE (UPF0421/DUF939 family)